MKNETIRNNITELVFILDRSGSMSGLEGDTIGGFNSMIAKQKKQEGKTFVSTILFNQQSEVVHDRVALEDVPDMTDQTYTVGGCTALLDAIGDAVHHVRNIHKYAREEDVPAHTLFVITTDGMENASHRYTVEKIREMIEKQKASAGWEFIFLGANIDAVKTAQHLGIREDRSVTYLSDSAGTAQNYEAVCACVSDVRAGRSIRPNWAEKIRKDYASRSTK